MSYEDVNEIKTKLHNAYCAACDTIGEGAPCAEVVAFESVDLKFSIKVEKVNFKFHGVVMPDIVQIQHPKSRCWTKINRSTGMLIDYTLDSIPFPNVEIIGKYEIEKVAQ